MKRLVPLLLAALVLLQGPAAFAQPPEEQVQKLNHRAMDAYLGLDIDHAKKLLVEALRIAEREGIEGETLARTYVNLGVVVVAGEKDRSSGFEFFKAALKADPSIRPDPATSTPDVDETFELARGAYEVASGKELPAAEMPETPPNPYGQPKAATEPRATSTPYDWGRRRRAFIHLGFSAGMASARSGKPADPQPPPQCFVTATGPLAPECESYIPPHQDSCHGDKYCVRVERSGVLPAFGVNIAAGYYIAPHFAAALTARIGLQGGSAALSQVMIGARLQYALFEPNPTGFALGLLLGGSVGQIQVKPDQSNLREPFITSGLGSVQVGAVIGYRIVPAFGIVATPTFHFFFPTTMVVGELSLGIEVAL